MRLTLKKLLDYRDDRLSPVETKELGKILAENAEACKWLDQLDKALWGNSPQEPTGPAEPIATIARYLDNRLDPTAEAELEKRALQNPALLVEIARCHQLISTARPKVRRLNHEGVEDSEGSLLEWPEGQLDLLDLTLENLAAISKEKPEVIATEYENPLEILGDHFLAKTTVSKKPHTEDEDPGGAVWRLALIGFCFLGLSGLMGFWNGPEAKSNTLMASANPFTPEGMTKANSRMNGDNGPGIGPLSGTELDQKKVDSTGKAKEELTKKDKPQPIEKGKDANPPTLPKTEVNPFQSPPIKVGIQAGQVAVLGPEGTILEGLPSLVWSKGQNHERRMAGDFISWSRDIFIPSGFVAALDAKAGWRVFALGLCPTIAGAEKPLGTKLRFEAGPLPNNPVLYLSEGQVEIHTGGAGEALMNPGGILLNLNGQFVSLKPVGKVRIVVEVVPRNAKSTRPDWEIHILEGMVEFQAADGQSPVNMFGPPGLCVARHSFSGGIALEKSGTTPPGFGALWWGSLPRNKEFSAAAGEILSITGTNWNSPLKIQTVLNQPSANLARKVLCVQLACWLGAPEMALQHMGDPRPSMKELRAGALAVLAQSSRRDSVGWNRLFGQTQGKSLLPKDLESFGETVLFRQLVESLGRGESLSVFENRSLDLLVEGKSLWIREAAYGYLLEAVQPATGPRYDPASSEKARKGSQALWARLFGNAG